MALFFKFVDVTLFIFYFLTTLADKLSFKTESKGHPKTTFYGWIGFLPAPTTQSTTHGLDFIYQIAPQILKLNKLILLIFIIFGLVDLIGEGMLSLFTECF